MTTTDQLAAYDVRSTLVPWVDNDGEPCEFCQVIGNVIEATVTGHSLELDVDGLSNDCCADCVNRLVVERYDISYPVRIEWSLTQLGEYDDRMSGPDDDRPHPDAL